MSALMVFENRLTTHAVRWACCRTHACSGRRSGFEWEGLSFGSPVPFDVSIAKIMKGLIE